jgi:hypothetical protein
MIDGDEASKSAIRKPFTENFAPETRSLTHLETFVLRLSNKSLFGWIIGSLVRYGYNIDLNGSRVCDNFSKLYFQYAEVEN